MRYALTIRGKVQDVGYRNFIEMNAHERRLGGYVFNDVDGTVKLVCDGVHEKIEEFIDAINLHDEDIFVENIRKEEVVPTHPVPKTFVRLQTDTLNDFGRKLDIGNTQLKRHSRILKDMNGKIGSMDGKLGSMDGKLGKLDKLDSMDGKLDDMNRKLDKLDSIEKGQNKMISILEKNNEILAKIANK